MCLSSTLSGFSHEYVVILYIEYHFMWHILVVSINFMVTPCINNIQHFNNQLTHTTLKNVELLKHF